MLRSARAVLAILVVLGSFSLSAGASARDGGHGVDGGAAGSRGNNFGGGFGVTPGDGHDGYGTSGLPSELRGYGRHDVWGHWGAYYGPMIPMI
jgi:hypothetical protein